MNENNIKVLATIILQAYTFKVYLFLRCHKSLNSIASRRLSNDVKSIPINIESNTLRYDSSKDLIGEGGFCYVYRAQIISGDFVAVKRLKTDLIHMPVLYEDCMRKEVRCLKNLLHPNIVQFLGIVWEPHFHAVLLEYVAYGDLLNFLTEQSLHPYLKAKLLGDISKGVHYLHWLPKQIIHNDLKASNILISDDIVAKITDFGTADWNSFTTQLLYGPIQETHQQCATNTHISPERWQDINECNTKSDVYSYGIIIWELYSEKKPFANIKNDDIKLAVTDGQRPDENMLSSDTPPEIIELMKQCWHQQPSKRPDMKLVADKLEDLLSSDEHVQHAVSTSIAQFTQSVVRDCIARTNDSTTFKGNKVNSLDKEKVEHLSLLVKHVPSLLENAVSAKYLLFIQMYHKYDIQGQMVKQYF